MSDKFARDARLSACRARRELPLARSRTIIWFDDAANSTSNIEFIRQSSALDIGKLTEDDRGKMSSRRKRSEDVITCDSFNFSLWL